MAYRAPRPGEGRPPKFKSVEEIQIKIDKYFEECNGIPLKDEDGHIYLDKFNSPIIWKVKPVTVTGLAIALGFLSRQSLIEYQDKDEFTDAITRAKNFCQNYAETRLFDKEGSAGAKFSLQNNWNWREKSEIESTNKNYNTDCSGLTDAEIDEALAELQDKNKE